MSIQSKQVVSWSDLSSMCYNTIINTCCNIDSYKNVPLTLQETQGQTVVYAQPTGWPYSKGTVYHYYYANPENLIQLVQASKVLEEWNDFMGKAGIDTKSRDIVKADQLGLAIGLYMEFMSLHLKPVYSRRKIYDTVESQSLFKGTKYVTGKIDPSYSIPHNKTIGPDSIQDNATVENIINKNITADKLLSSHENPVLNRNYLS